MDLVLASLGARCDEEEGYVYFPFSPASLPESYPRSGNDKSVARIFKNLAILYRALPTTRHLALCILEVISGSPYSMRTLVLLSCLIEEATEAQTGTVVPQERRSTRI